MWAYAQRNDLPCGLSRADASSSSRQDNFLDIRRRASLTETDDNFDSAGFALSPGHTSHSLPSAVSGARSTSSTDFRTPSTFTSTRFLGSAGLSFTSSSSSSCVPGSNRTRQSSNCTNPFSTSSIGTPPSKGRPSAADPTLAQHPPRRASAPSSSSANSKTAVQKQRNRVAATKCRNKSKAAASQLQAEARDVGELNTALKQTWAALKDETMALQNQLLMHVHCECGLIHTWARSRSRKVAEDVARRAAAVGEIGEERRRDWQREKVIGMAWENWNEDQDGLDVGSDVDAEYEDNLVEDGR
ncbi:hypothetical protein GE09DRAFT_1257104 [Coniochaeta sp. 2T2.1]|nr:hypothetical protein GE09DRAFT_1257104 [Coniochaeta sp. 2T2.1]